MLPLASAISNRLDKSSSQRTCEIVNFSLISVDFCYWLFGRSRGGGLSDGERIFDRKRPCHRSRSLLFQRTDEIHLGASRSLRKTPADSPEARGGVVTPTLITPPSPPLLRMEQPPSPSDWPEAMPLDDPQTTPWWGRDPPGGGEATQRQRTKPRKLNSTIEDGFYFH